MKESLIGGIVEGFKAKNPGMEIDYQQYIDGKKEIAQLNAEYRANTIIGH